MVDGIVIRSKQTAFLAFYSKVSQSFCYVCGTSIERAQRAKRVKHPLPRSARRNFYLPWDENETESISVTENKSKYEILEAQKCNKGYQIRKNLQYFIEHYCFY